MTPTAFDFRKQPAGDGGRQVSEWLAAAVRRAGGIWPALLAYPVELTVGPVDALPAAAGLAALPPDAVGFTVGSDHGAEESFLVAVRRPLVVALLAGLMGETPDALPADRDLTELESTLLDYLARELVLAPLEQGWPLGESLRLTAGPVTTPRAAWRGATEDMVVRAGLAVSAPFGRDTIQLLLPHAGPPARLIRPVGRPAAAPDPAARGQIEALVREMAVDLDVVLGTADLTMSDLARLRAGDLIVLRQRVNEPLDGLVAGERKFRLWPGAVGPRAAVRVHAAAEL